jgi:GPI mannosyltransferase 3
MEQGRRAESSGYWLVVALVVVVAIGLRAALYDPFAQYHADEFYQYLEQAHRLADGWGLVAWEGREGIRSALIPQFLAPWWQLGSWIAPGTMAPIHFARIAFAALCLLALAGAWGIGRARSREDGLAALLAAAVWYDCVFFGTTLLSESLATALLVCGAALLLVERAKVRTLRLAGFLLVLGLLVRLQYAPFVAVLAMVSVVRERRLWQPLLVGGFAALALGAVSDLAMGRAPFAWAVGALQANLGQGIAARYGVEGPWFYAGELQAAFGPAAVAIFVASLFAGKRYWPLVLANLTNLAVHSLIAHKEPRFVFLSLFLTLILAAIASVKAVNWVVDWRRAGLLARRFGLLAMLALWLALAAASWRDRDERFERAGAAYARATHELASRPGICGLAVPEEWHNHVITAFTGRNVPLYVMPVELLGGLSPLPEELAASANAAINDGELLSNPEYEEVVCHEENGQNACLLVREGGCKAAAGRNYEKQAWMVEKDM